MTQSEMLYDDASAPATQAVDFVRLPTAPRYPNNLPLPLTSFVGRDSEIGTIKQRLWTTRLLTLNGPGGCGKTRLALKVAAELLDAFQDGVWFIELASLSDGVAAAHDHVGVGHDRANWSHAHRRPD